MDNGAGTKRLLAVVARFRLDAVDGAARRQGAGRQRRSGEQAAAAKADEEPVEFAKVFEQLLRRRALAGDHIGVVVRRNQRQPVLLREVTADLLAVFAI